MALEIWKQNLFLEENQVIFRDFFENVQLEREKSGLNLDVLRDISNSLCKLNFAFIFIVEVDKFSLNQSETFKSLFQDPMLKLTSEFYENEAKIKVELLNISDYMVYVKLI